MAKRIFKIAGIVIGAVTLFVAAVIGVMALMGKFKTPIIYPARLTFVDDSQTIVKPSDNSEGSNGLYSFILTGFSSSGDAVNQKTCYIYFENNIGSDLITLCDQNGTPLIAENNRYKVNCDEAIYFKLKEVNSNMFENTTFGKVVIKARDEKNQVQSNALTIWIDRDIESIYIDDGSDINTLKNLKDDESQIITLGLDSIQSFDYIATPEFSLHPISRESGKIIELYYHDPNEIDYVRINTSTYMNYNFISYDSGEGKFYFKSNIAGDYNFMIAVFATYQERAEYLASAESSTNSNILRISKMISRQVQFDVINADIDEVLLKSTGVSLNLYSDNNYITLNGSSGATGNKSDLKLSMSNKGVTTTTRLNEVDFLNDNSWNITNILFKDGDVSLSIKSNNIIVLSGFNDDGLNGEKEYTISGNSLKIIDTAYIFTIIYENKLSLNGNKVIDSITYSTYIFECSNGVAIVEDVTNLIKMLKSGSYLDFYDYDNTTETYKSTIFEYSILSKSGSGNLKTWNVVAKNEPDVSENLVLMILVINSDGKYFIAQISVGVNTVPLTREFVGGTSNRNRTIELNYQTSGIINYKQSVLSFEDLITITGGTYNACVFVTQEAATYDIEVFENIKFVNDDGRIYVLVGYIEGTRYVNSIRAKAGATNIGASIYMIQLQNGYNQTAEDYITSILQQSLSWTYSYNDGTNEKEIVVTFNDDGTIEEIAEDSKKHEYKIKSDGLYITIEGTDYKCEFRHIENGTSTYYLDDRRDSDSELAIVLNTYFGTSNAITINVSYYLDTAALRYENDNIADDDYLHERDGKIYVMENTIDHQITLTNTNNNLVDMLNNIYNTEDYAIRVKMYDNSNQWKGYTEDLYIKNIDLNGNNIIITYDSRASLLGGYYLTFVFEYNGKSFESSRIYIESSAVTDINFISEDGENIIHLSETAIAAQNNNNVYLEVEITYDAVNKKYVYTYKLFDKDKKSNSPLMTTFDIDVVFKEWILINPDIEAVIRSLEAQTQQQNDYINIDYSTENTEQIVEIKKVGSTVLALTSEGITRYIKIIVSAIVSDNGFNLESSKTIVETTSNSMILTSEGLSYKYDGNTIAFNSEFVSISPKVVSYSKGATEIVLYDNVYYIFDKTIEVGNRTYGTDGNYILSIYSDSETWQIVRNNSYINTTINVELEFSVVPWNDSIVVSVIFTSDFDVPDNSDFGSTVYAGTTILLAEQSTTGVWEHTPMFFIKSIASDTNFSISITFNGTTNTIGGDGNLYKHKFENAGAYILVFSFAGTSIREVPITVVPNYVIVPNYAKDLNDEILDYVHLLGDSSYNMSELFILKQYNTSQTYGMGKGNEAILYTVDNLEDETTFPGFNAEIVNTPSQLLTGGSTINVNWIEDIDYVAENQIRIKLDGFVIGVFDVIITNKYKIDFDADQKNYDFQSNRLTLISGIASDSPYSIGGNFELISVTAATLTSEDIEVGAGIKFNKIIIENTTYYMTFTFKDGDKTLTYKVYVDVVPYTPKDIKETEDKTIYSSNEYDLMDLFDIDSDFEDLVSRMEIAFDDNRLTDHSGNGYQEGSSDNNRTVIIGTIFGDNYDVTLTIRLTYKSGQIYTYERTITIHNAQEIDIQYPFSDLKSEASMNFVIANELDAKQLAIELNKKLDDIKTVDQNIYSLSNYHYETILVGQTIDFSKDSNLSNITRAIVSNRVNGDANEETFTVSVAGYQNRATVINSITNIKINGSKVHFDVASTLSVNSAGTVILKVTSSTGAVAYYFVYIYNNNNTVYANANAKTIKEFDKTIVDDEKFVNNNKFLSITDTLDSAFFNSNFGVAVDLGKVRFYLLEAEILGEDLFEDYLPDLSTGGDYALYDEISNKTLPNLYNYATIKIGLVFIDSSVRFHFGNIQINIVPNHASSLIAQDETGEELQGGLGKYDYIIKNTGDFENPFSGIIGSPEVTIVNIDGEQVNATNIGDIINIDGTNVEFNKYLTDSDLMFTVQYAYDISGRTFILLINMTYKQFILNTSDFKATTGLYSSGAFNNEIALSDIIGNYKGGITITTDKGSATITLPHSSTTTIDDDNELSITNGKLVFAQRHEQYIKNFSITLNDTEGGNNSRNSTITVGSNLYSTFGTGNGSGYDSSTPINIKDNSGELALTNNYSSEYGSELTISKVGNTFKIGKLTITADSGAALEITGDDSTYIAGNFKAEAYMNWIVEQDGTNKIQFVHSANNNTKIAINIRVKLNSDYYQGSSGEEIIYKVYITIPQTYTTFEETANYPRLIPVYITNAIDNYATHENVTSAGSIDNIYSHMFDSIGKNGDIYNTCRFILIDKTNGKALTDVSYSAMGFNNSDNPNYISFEAGANSTLTNRKLTFSTVTKNADSILIIKNSFDVHLEYNFQIMPKEVETTTPDIYELNGINFANDDHGTSGSYYTATTIQDIDESKTYNKDITIGTMRDGKNSIFVINNISLTIDGGSVTGASVTMQKDTIENTITNTITINSYGIKLIITKTKNNEIIVKYERAKDGTLFDKLQISLDIYDDNGLMAGYSAFTILIYNYKLESVYPSTGSGETIYAGGSVVLDSSRIKVTGRTGEYSGFGIILDTNGGSTYKVGINPTVTIYNEDNAVFKYTGTDKTLITKAVGIETTIIVTFVVKDGNYIVGYLTYRIALKMNLRYEVNGEALPVGNSEFDTDYLMTEDNLDDEDTVNKIFYTQSLITTLGGSNPNPNSDGVYNDLRLRLYSIDPRQEKTIGGVVEIIIVNDAGDYGVSLGIDGYTLTFAKDFTGTIVLRLRCNLGSNGIYEVLWNIHVTGFVALEYTKTLGENAIINTSGGEGFVSGSRVNPISIDKTATGTSIQMTALEIKNESVLGETKPIDITAAIDYVITNATSSVNAKQLFENNTPISLDEHKFTGISNLVLTLPYVPQSEGTSNTYYFVTYRITLAYLDNTTGYYYVTYRVYNNKSISANGSSTVYIPEAAEEGCKTLTSDSSSYNLELFYYAVEYQYTKDSTTYVLTVRLNESKSKTFDLLIGEDENIELTSTGNNEYIGGVYKATVNNDTIVLYNGANQIFRYSTTNHGGVTKREITKTDNTLFTGVFSSIEEFASYLNLINIEFTNANGLASGAESTYDVNYIANGVFGIKFAKNTTLFNNELIADINVKSKGQTIAKIEKYSTEAVTGFKLTTTEAITPKTQDVKLSDMFSPRDVEEKYYDYNVIGVYSDLLNTSSWTNKGVIAEETNSTDVCTITIDGTEYNLRMLTFKATVIGTTFYSLEATFYAIYSSTGSVITLDYRTSIQSYYFQVNYDEENGNTDSVFNMTGRLKTWANDAGILKASNTSITDLTTTSEEYSAIAGNNSTITVSHDTLQKYKNDNPYEIELSLTYQVTGGGVTRTFIVAFMLPDSVTFEQLYTQAIDSTYNMSTSISAWGYSSSVTISQTTGYSGVSIDNNAKTITVLNTILQDYKNNNPTTEYLSLTFTVRGTVLGTTKTIEFVINFELPDSTT